KRFGFLQKLFLYNSVFLFPFSFSCPFSVPAIPEEPKCPPGKRRKSVMPVPQTEASPFSVSAALLSEDWEFHHNPDFPAAFYTQASETVPPASADGGYIRHIEYVYLPASPLLSKAGVCPDQAAPESHN